MQRKRGLFLFCYFLFLVLLLKKGISSPLCVVEECCFFSPFEEYSSGEEVVCALSGFAVADAAVVHSQFHSSVRDLVGCEGAEPKRSFFLRFHFVLSLFPLLGTTFALNCPTCQQPLSSSSWLCSNCKKVTSSCSLCKATVKGLFSWCQGCGHGGHAKEMTEWWKKEHTCPEPACYHECKSKEALF